MISKEPPKELSIDDAIRVVYAIEAGKKPEHGGYAPDFTIGTVRPCSMCGKPAEAIDYEHSLYWFDYVDAICLDCYKPMKLPTCSDENCKVHMGFNVDEFNQDEEVIHDIRLKCRQVVEKLKPKPIYLDWTRTKYVAAHSVFYTLSPDKYTFWLEQAYKLYIYSNGGWND